jgi:tRNA (guanine37-N1)-methyltransferase
MEFMSTRMSTEGIEGGSGHSDEGVGGAKTGGMRIDILTTFPEMFAWSEGDAMGGGAGGGGLAGGGCCGLSASIPARARRAGLIEWHAHNIRAHSASKHDKTDDRPFGGGPGMVMMCQPLFDCVKAVEGLVDVAARRIVFTPQGVALTQGLVRELAQSKRLLLIAGHYEGIDERVIEELGPLEVSIGDYVLSGGELGAMVLIDAIARVLPGALGHELSAAQDSFAVEKVQGVDRRLLDCAHYTRPRVWKGREVPEVLLSGDHGAISKWRLEQRLLRTAERRPDLLR